MNPKRHQRWIVWRHQEHLQAVVAHAQLLTMYRQHSALCDELQSYVSEYDQQTLQGAPMSPLDLRISGGFANQIHRVQLQQQVHTQQLNQQLEVSRQRVQQRQARLTQLLEMQQRQARERLRHQEHQDQLQVQELMAQRGSLPDGH